MGHLQQLLVVIILVALPACVLSCAQTLSPDFEEIRDQFVVLRDNNPNLQSSWNLADHICCWNGLTCFQDNGTFAELRFIDLVDLQGPPFDLTMVTTLTGITLNNVQFDVPITTAGVFTLMFSPLLYPKLQKFGIINSNMEGDIAEFAEFFQEGSSLNSLALSGNRIYGQVPLLPNFDSMGSIELQQNYLDGPQFANFTGHTLGVLQLDQTSPWMFDCPLVPSVGISTCSSCGSLESIVNGLSGASYTRNPSFSFIPYPPPKADVNDSPQTFECDNGLNRVGTNERTVAYRCMTDGGYECIYPGGCECAAPGCDGRGGSGLVDDACNVCGGDGQTCLAATVRTIFNFFPASVMLNDTKIMVAVVELIPTSNNVFFGNLTVESVAATAQSQVVTLDIATTNEYVDPIVAALLAMGKGNLTNPAPLGLKLSSFPNLQGVETASAAKFIAQPTITPVTTAAVVTTEEASTGSSTDNLPLIAGLAGAAGLFFLLCLYFMCCRRRGGGGSQEEQRKANWDNLVINSSHPITVEGFDQDHIPRSASMGSGVSHQTDSSGAPLIKTTEGWEMKNPMFIDDSETTTDPKQSLNINDFGQTSSGTDPSISVAIPGVTDDAVVDHINDDEVEFGFGFGFNTTDIADEPAVMESKVELPETVIASKITLRKKKVPESDINTEEEQPDSTSVKSALSKFETAAQPLSNASSNEQTEAMYDTADEAQFSVGSVGTLPKTKKAPPIPASTTASANSSPQPGAGSVLTLPKTKKAPPVPTTGNNVSVAQKSATLNSLKPIGNLSSNVHTGSFRRRESYENTKIGAEPPLPTKTAEAVFEPGLYGNQDVIDEQGKDAADQEARGRTASVAARAKDARMKALAAEQEKLRQEKEKVVHPRQWSSVECLEWLKFHGFKDFRETFYNNGFEGRQLIALTVGSFSGMRSHTPERVRELIGAIAQLRHDGYWIKPENSPDEPEEVEKPPMDLPSQVPLPGERRDSSIGSMGRTTSMSRVRTASVVSNASLPDSGDMDEERMNYFLTIKMNREDCTRMLHPETNKDGVFIVRKSKTKTDTYVLTMVYQRKLQHFPIQYRSFDKMFATQLGHKFASLAALVHHFKQKDGDGLPCRLAHHSRYYDKRIKRKINESVAANARPAAVVAPPIPSGLRPSATQEFQPGTENYEMITPTEKQKQDFKSFTESARTSANNSKRSSVAAPGSYEEVDFVQETYEAMDAPAQQNYEAMGSGAPTLSSPTGGKPKPRGYENVRPGGGPAATAVTVQEPDDPYNHLPPAK